MNTNCSHYDVGIIGAGPAGSFCAYLLAKQGFRVILVEASPSFKRKVCGEYLCPAGVKLLQQYGFGEYLDQHFLPIYGMKLVAPSFRSVKTYFASSDSKNAYGISTPRDHFDRFLAQEAEKAGATVLLKKRALHFQQQPPFWNVHFSDQTQFSCKLLIGADGRRSVVAKHLKLKAQLQNSRVAVHCFLSSKKQNERFGEMHIFKDGSYIGINPVEENKSNISLVCDIHLLKKAGNVEHVLRSYLQQSPMIFNQYEIPTDFLKFSTTYPITYHTTSVIGPQCALIGDAAGFIDPLTGEGMYNALWTASFLAQKISETSHPFKEKTLENTLRQYARGKKQQFRQKSFVSKMFQRIIRSQFLCERVADVLVPNQKRANIFIRMVGNLYQPFYGLFLFLKSFIPLFE